MYNHDGDPGEHTIYAWMVEKEWWDKMADDAYAMEITRSLLAPP